MISRRPQAALITRCDAQAPWCVCHDISWSSSELELAGVLMPTIRFAYGTPVACSRKLPISVSAVVV
jgi:hypothetical protein